MVKAGATPSLGTRAAGPCSIDAEGRIRQDEGRFTWPSAATAAEVCAKSRPRSGLPELLLSPASGLAAEDIDDFGRI